MCMQSIFCAASDAAASQQTVRARASYGIWKFSGSEWNWEKSAGAHIHAVTPCIGPTVCIWIASLNSQKCVSVSCVCVQMNINERKCIRRILCTHNRTHYTTHISTTSTRTFQWFFVFLFRLSSCVFSHLLALLPYRFCALCFFAAHSSNFSGNNAAYFSTMIHICLEFW